MLYFRSLFLVLILLSSQYSSSETVKLTSLYWPPYSGPELEGEGASIAVIRAAFESMGYKLHVDYFPWPRTLAKAEDSNSAYIGYAPEYYSPVVESKFIFSDSIGESPLGLMQRWHQPIQWQDIMDLRQYKIGVVRDYVNTTEFDYAIARGVLSVDESIDDVTNLKKVFHQRLDAAVIDPNVMEFLLNTHDEFAMHKKRLNINSKLLEMKQLYVCFRISEQGKKIVAVLNEGLKKIDREKIYRYYLAINKQGREAKIDK